MLHADRRADVSPAPAAVRRPGPAPSGREQITIQGADPARSSQPEWTATICTHDPACPAADAIDWRAARTITEHPLPTAPGKGEP
jgi:hypothetical protein